MIEWCIEPEIVFLLKTMKKSHLNDALTKGELCFNIPDTFSNSLGSLGSAQTDTWDARMFYTAENIYCYPLIEDSLDNPVYGPGFKLCDKAMCSEINSRSKQTPYCCFRKITKDDFKKRENTFVYSLGNIVDRIKQEFKHDSYIIILFVDEFVKRLSNQTPCFGKSIHYGELSSEYRKEIDENEKTGFQQIKMFQKRDDYAWQKEYRIIIPPIEDAKSTIIEIGSIEDIAVGGDIDQLKLGLAFGTSIEDFNNAH